MCVVKRKIYINNDNAFPKIHNANVSTHNKLKIDTPKVNISKNIKIDQSALKNIPQGKAEVSLSILGYEAPAVIDASKLNNLKKDLDNTQKNNDTNYTFHKNDLLLLDVGGKKERFNVIDIGEKSVRLRNNDLNLEKIISKEELNELGKNEVFLDYEEEFNIEGLGKVKLETSSQDGFYDLSYKKDSKDIKEKISSEALGFYINPLSEKEFNIIKNEKNYLEFDGERWDIESYDAKTGEVTLNKPYKETWDSKEVSGNFKNIRLGETAVYKDNIFRVSNINKSSDGNVKSIDVELNEKVKFPASVLFNKKSNDKLSNTINYNQKNIDIKIGDELIAEKSDREKIFYVKEIKDHFVKLEAEDGSSIISTKEQLSDLNKNYSYQSNMLSVYSDKTGGRIIIESPKNDNSYYTLSLIEKSQEKTIKLKKDNLVKFFEPLSVQEFKDKFKFEKRDKNNPVYTDIEDFIGNSTKYEILDYSPKDGEVTLGKKYEETFLASELTGDLSLLRENMSIPWDGKSYNLDKINKDSNGNISSIVTSIFNIIKTPSQALLPYIENKLKDTIKSKTNDNDVLVNYENKQWVVKDINKELVTIESSQTFLSKVKDGKLVNNNVEFSSDIDFSKVKLGQEIKDVIGNKWTITNVNADNYFGLKVGLETKESKQVNLKDISNNNSYIVSKKNTEKSLDGLKKISADSLGLQFKETINKYNFISSKSIEAADIYQINIKNKDKKIDLVLPKSYNNKPLIEILKKNIALLPIKYIDSLDIIRVNPKDCKYGNWAGSADPIKAIDLYPRTFNSNTSIFEILSHELGHLISLELYNSYKPNTMWDSAVVKDKKFVSNYSQTDIREDFAETVAKYIITDAGKNPPSVRNEYSERFKYLDNIFGSDETLKAQKLESAKATFEKSGIVLGIGIMLIANQGFIYQEEENKN